MKYVLALLVLIVATLIIVKNHEYKIQEVRTEYIQKIESVLKFEQQCKILSGEFYHYYSADKEITIYCGSDKNVKLSAFCKINSGRLVMLNGVEICAVTIE